MPQSTQKPLIVIPARLASTRLANKVLADMDGLPMIVQVLHRAQEAVADGLGGQVVVAAGDKEIVEVVQAHGGRAVLTDAALPSGTDRVWQAVRQMEEAEQYNVIVNVQGDLPTLDPKLIGTVAGLVTDAVDIATLVAEIKDTAERDDPNCVKAVVAWEDETARKGRALYFTRTPAPYGADVLYHHIGLYAYRREALADFVSLPPSPLEQCEKLEQLRALENNMTICVGRVDTVPLGVDVAADIDKAVKELQRQQMGKKK